MTNKDLGGMQDLCRTEPPFFFSLPAISAALQAFNFQPRSSHHAWLFLNLIFAFFSPVIVCSCRWMVPSKTQKNADGFHHSSVHTQGQSNKSPNSLPEPISFQAGRLTAFIKILSGKGVFSSSFFFLPDLLVIAR